MICTFCGTENPKENRFCGMCGVRLERRKAERRVTQRGSVTCSGCGHVNELGFKFCGMCGVRVDQRVQERRAANEASRATAVANTQLPTPEARRGGVERGSASAWAVPSPANRERQQSGTVVHTQHSDVPRSVSGPSFLGLSDSTEAEYLLEDEGSSHRGLRTFLLLVVLAAIVGLIFVQYRSSLQANPKSPEAPKPGPATVPRPEGKSQPPGKEKTLLAAVAAHNLQSAVTDVAKAQASEPLSGDDDPVAGKKSRLQASAPAQDDPPNNRNPARGANPPAEVNDQPSPALIKAQQYLHGRGVHQDCEQGLVYLRAAARENDPQAAVQMAALYSSGFCVGQDRVKAYQWFTSAREMEPGNRWIARNLSQLWAQMSPQERRLIHQ